MRYTFQWRRGSSLLWERRNPILRDGEPGKETDTGRYKLGDGVTAWNDLPYFVNEAGVIAIVESLGGPGGSDLQSHINSPLPHPVYDDGPDLVLLYENAKV